MISMVPPPSEGLDDAVRAAAVDNRISCGAAFRVAAAQGVAVGEVGRAIERLGIKIKACQLGCFK